MRLHAMLIVRDCRIRRGVAALHLLVLVVLVHILRWREVIRLYCVDLLLDFVLEEAEDLP